jgi:hypothetical protein
MIQPVTFPRTAGTTATYMHPLLQSTMLQSARPTDTLVGQPAVTAPPPPVPQVPSVAAVDRAAAYSAGLARDAMTMANSAKAAARSAPAGADPATDLARTMVLDREANQVGMLLTRAAAERRVALHSGVPASRLAEINTSTSRLYHALDVLV